MSTIETGRGWTMHLGDCLEVMPTLGKVDAVVTDPPYGIDCTKTGASARKGCLFKPGLNVNVNRFTDQGKAVIAGDKSPNGAWLHLAATLMPRGTLLSFSRWDVDREWHSFIEAAGFTVRNRITWVKPNHGSGDLVAAYGCSHETIWRAQMGRIAIQVPRCGDVWNESFTECVRHGKTHPFEKPVDIMQRLIDGDTEPCGSVLDPFAGSGTTGVACLRLGRTFIGIEKDPTYFRLACDRLRAEENGSTLQAARAGQEALFGGVKS